jgi:hypothetical protein
MIASCIPHRRDEIQQQSHRLGLPGASLPAIRRRLASSASPATRNPSWTMMSRRYDPTSYGRTRELLAEGKARGLPAVVTAEDAVIDPSQQSTSAKSSWGMIGTLFLSRRTVP